MIGKTLKSRATGGVILDHERAKTLNPPASADAIRRIEQLDRATRRPATRIIVG